MIEPQRPDRDRLNAAGAATLDATWKYSPSGRYMEVNGDTVARDGDYAVSLLSRAGDSANLWP
jgi:hypothetical protein